jgi:RNA polymerase sigma factor (sigma-70 family)
MNTKAFLVALFEKHQADLRRSIAARFGKIRHEAEDIVQDAFHNLLRAQNLEELENPRAYLYQTAANLALNRIRKHRHHNQYLEQQGVVIEEDEMDDLGPERQVMARRDLASLEQALMKLPEKYRRTFLLSRMQDKSYKEISQLLGMPESTVEKHIIKVLKHLREHLASEAGS